MLFLYFYGDFTYYMHAFIYILCHCIHIIHVIYPHIHVNMYVYSCKYVVNKLKLKLKKKIPALWLRIIDDSRTYTDEFKSGALHENHINISPNCLIEHLRPVLY